MLTGTALNEILRRDNKIKASTSIQKKMFLVLMAPNRTVTTMGLLC